MTRIFALLLSTALLEENRMLIHKLSAIVARIQLYAPLAKTIAFATKADKFRSYASAWRDRWNSVMELFMAGGDYAASGVPFPTDFLAAVNAEIAAAQQARFPPSDFSHSTLGKGHSLMRIFILPLVAIASLATAASATDSLSGLPIFPGAVVDSADGEKSDTVCGKAKHTIMYYAYGSSEVAEENAWYTHALPGAIVLSSKDDLRTFFTKDGTAAVATHGFVISFSKFSPGLTPQEMRRDANLSADCK